MNQNQTKKAYQAPRLTVHGEVSEVTQATLTGPRSDRAFPNDTPLATILQNLS